VPGPPQLQAIEAAIWLSPIFENNDGAYHGYNINNYLGVDPNFGTKEDLVELVEAAHARNPPIRIILDIVVNHSGDNWFYPGDVDYFYFKDEQFPFGDWRCHIYEEIAKIAAVMRSREPLRFGRMYFRQISGDGITFITFGYPYGSSYTLAFSRMLYGQEILVAYNVAPSPRTDCVVVDSALHPDGDTMTFLYGATGSVPVNTAHDGTRFVRLALEGRQFVILG
jgi:hypothetical protein